MRPVVAVLLLAPAFAGCLAGVTDESLAPSGVADAALFAWSGGSLTGSPPTLRGPMGITTCLAARDCPEPAVDCKPANCERTTFRVDVPDGFEGQLAVAMRWPTDHELWYLLRVEDASGKVVAKGGYGYFDHLSALALVDSPTSGNYTAIVILAQGKGTYEAAASLLAKPRHASGAELLPDIITLPPTDLRIELPRYFGAGSLGLIGGEPHLLVATATGARGCAADEVAAGARRCLRFTNAIANVGEGDLEVRLAPGSQRFTQRIFIEDGSHRDVPAGAAEWHAIHAHWHNTAAAQFTIHAYDEAAASMGEPLKTGRKTGICFADVGLVNLTAPRMDAHARDGGECFNPSPQREWVLGLDVGWYDSYDWILSDQYVEISGLADGAYALCSAANPEGVLREMDPTNNDACALFRLSGDKVEVFSREPYHKWPDGL